MSETRRKRPLSWNNHITLPYLTLPAAQTIVWLQPSRHGKEEIADRKTAPKLLLVKPKWTLLPHIDMSDAYLHHTQRDSKSQPKWVPQKKKKKKERKKTRAALDRAQGKASWSRSREKLTARKERDQQTQKSLRTAGHRRHPQPCLPQFSATWLWGAMAARNGTQHTSFITTLTRHHIWQVKGPNLCNPAPLGTVCRSAQGTQNFVELSGVSIPQGRWANLAHFQAQRMHRSHDESLKQVRLEAAAALGLGRLKDPVPPREAKLSCNTGQGKLGSWEAWWVRVRERERENWWGM